MVGPKCQHVFWGREPGENMKNLFSIGHRLRPSPGTAWLEKKSRRITTNITVCLKMTFIFEMTRHEVWVAWSKSICVCVCMCVWRSSANPEEFYYRFHITSLFPKGAIFRQTGRGQAEAGGWTRCNRGFDAPLTHARLTTTQTKRAVTKLITLWTLNSNLISNQNTGHVRFWRSSMSILTAKGLLERTLFNFLHLRVSELK